LAPNLGTGSCAAMVDKSFKDLPLIRGFGRFQAEKTGAMPLTGDRRNIARVGKCCPSRSR